MDYAQKNFDESFMEYRNSSMAIYGVGKNAEYILKNIKGYNIRCLIDGNIVGSELYGLPVVSIYKALSLSDVIVIAATPASTRIVYNRIKGILPAEFPVFDMQGHRLNVENIRNPYWDVCYEDLCKKIDDNEIVTFDIFDTLLMRRVLEPRDVFFLVERELRENGNNIPFAEWRIESEKILRLDCKEPSLDEIYEYMSKKNAISLSDIDKIKAMELLWEEKVLCPRVQVLDALKYATDKGKEVYLISDMYLPSCVLDTILKKNGISGYKKIFVSNEWGITKHDGGLYKVFLNSVKENKKIIHVGDNWFSDGEMARRFGISTFVVMSAKEMLETSAIAKIKKNVTNLDDKIFLGEVINVLFNSPFALSLGKGKIKFDNLATMACSCFVGVAMGVISWIIDKVKGKNAIVLFSSRDCYFLYQMYQKLKAIGLDIPTADYFYVSRQALRGGEITSFDRIEPSFQYARKAYSDMKFREYLNLVYGTDYNLSYDGLFGDMDDEEFNECLRVELANHRSEIVSTSKEKRDNFLRYINKKNLEKYREIYLVDIQTTGNSLSSLSNLITKKINLLTVRLIVNKDNEDLLNKSTYAKEISSLSSFSKKSMILEKVYASSGGQLIAFDQDGEPLFNDDTKYDVEMLKELQVNMEKFINSYLDKKWYTRKRSICLMLNMLDLLDPTCSIMDDSIIDKFVSHDYLSGHDVINEMKIIRNL